MSTGYTEKVYLGVGEEGEEEEEEEENFKYNRNVPNQLQIHH